MEEKRMKVNRDQKGWSRFCITIEPVLFVVSFLNNFTSGITIDLLQQNICQQKFNMSSEECSKTLPISIKSDIEAMTSDINMFNNMIQGICPIILVLCVGPWSDVNGRKHFIFWALRGFGTFYFLWGLLSLFPNIPVWCFLIPAIPLSLSGGFVSIIVCTQSYTADIWHEELRPFRISINICSVVCGSILANALSAPVFYSTGSVAYQVMYFSSAVLAVLGHLYVNVFVKETVIRKGKKTRLLDFAHMKNIVSVLIVKPIRGRFITFLSMTILTTEITSWVGEGNFIYLIGKSSFNWTLGDYNLFIAITTVISALSPVVGMWLLKKKLKLHSYTILAISSCNMFLFNVLKSYSVSQTMFWIVSSLIRVFTFIGPCIDSELSLLVHKNDLGKAYAFSSLLDAISPVFSLPLFNQIYKTMLPDRTLKMYLLASLLSGITAISSLVLLWNRHKEKTTITETSNESTSNVENKL